MLGKIFFFVIFLCGSLSLGIINKNNSISGKIIDVENGEPVPHVNVYLINTSIGASTDKNGLYEINNVPEGKYEIIVSSIGYESKTVNVIVKSAESLLLNVSLKKKSYKLKEIQINGIEDEEWQKCYKIFEKEILGTSENSEKCNILNKYQINFEKGKNWLIASSPVPIEIENKALGYQICLELTEFKINLNNFEISYTYFPYYKTLTPKSEKELKIWKKNRKKAYKGSHLHFLNCLATKNTYESGFVIIPRRLAVWNQTGLFSYNSYDDKDKQHQIVESIVDTISAIEMSLRIDDYLQIIYKNEENEEKFIVQMQRTGNRIEEIDKFQHSWIKIKEKFLFFNYFGYRTDQDSRLIKSGYWGWQRFADLVPENFAFID